MINVIKSFEIFEPFLGSFRISSGQVLVIRTTSYQKKIFQSILKRNEKVKIGQSYSVCSTEINSAFKIKKEFATALDVLDLEHNCETRNRTRKGKE